MPSLRLLDRIVHTSSNRAARLIARYAEGELGWVGRRIVKRHVETCGKCRATLHTIRLTLDGLASLEDTESAEGPDLTESVLARVREGERERAAPA